MTKLGELIELSNGRNSGRIKNDEGYAEYSTFDFKNDINMATEYIHKDNDSSFLTYTGQMLFSVVKGDATIVSKDNTGKIIKDFFIKVDVDTDKIYPWYLCYMINESEEIKREKYLNSKGVNILRFTSSFFKDLNLNIPDMKEQIKIGDLYKYSTANQYLEKKLADNKKEIVKNYLLGL